MALSPTVRLVLYVREIDENRLQSRFGNRNRGVSSLEQVIFQGEKRTPYFFVYADIFSLQYCEASMGRKVLSFDTVVGMVETPGPELPNLAQNRTSHGLWCRGHQGMDGPHAVRVDGRSNTGAFSLFPPSKMQFTLSASLTKIRNIRNTVRCLTVLHGGDRRYRYYRIS